MHIESLYLRHFRNCREETFHFSPTVNLIRGENGQGKTNLLEALFLVGTGRSFRTVHFKEMIHKEAPFFFIEAHFNKDGIQQKVRLSFDGEVKKLETNHTSYSHFNSLLGQLPIVLLSPEDVALVTGAPADRRRFLDLHLAQSDPLYVYHITRYHKAIKHRNLLLKQKKETDLEPWETLMVSAAAYIQEKRRHLTCALKEAFQASMRALSNHKDELEIRYHPSFTDNYLKHRAKELLIGSTLLGPHRDDLEILINGLPASSYASQGQLRSAVAALRLAQWHDLAKKHQTLPLFCIDDFCIHLDEPRREALLKASSSFGQVFLTSPVFLSNHPYHSLHLSNGTIFT
jgi:DNA replication and repair protein RecF